MTTNYMHINDLAKEVQPPEKGILSRTLFNDDRLKVVLFGFAKDEELSEHIASMPAIQHFLQVEAKLMLGDDTLEAKPGTWVHMPTGQRHSIQAKTPVVMLLMLIKESSPRKIGHGGDFSAWAGYLRATRLRKSSGTMREGTPPRS